MSLCLCLPLSAVVYRMVVGLTTTCGICAYHHKSCVRIPLMIYVIKFVSDLRQVVDFHQVPRFPQPIELTATV